METPHDMRGDEMGRVNLHDTTDAQVWAREFVHIIGHAPTADPYNGQFMMTWFANAIETGRRAGRDTEIKRDFMEKLHEIIYMAAGAATRPLLEDNPDYVFPSERVAKAVEECLEQCGILPREGYGG